MHKQDHATEVSLRHYHNRPEKTDGQVGGIFPGALFKRDVNLPIRVELYIPLSVEELGKAIDSLDYDCRKAAGKVIKAGEKGSSFLPAPAATAALGRRTPTSSLFTRTRVTTVTAKTTVESHTPMYYWESLCLRSPVQTAVTC